MSGLILKLGVKERVLINGAVVENGDLRSRLAIMTPNAHVLRLRDADPPRGREDPGAPGVLHRATGFVGRRGRVRGGVPQLLRGLEQLSQVFTDADSRSQLAAATEHLVAGQTYQMLKALRALISREDRLMATRPDA